MKIRRVNKLIDVVIRISTGKRFKQFVTKFQKYYLL